MYKCVVDDVVKNVREEFLNEGVETHILEEMKHVCACACACILRPGKADSMLLRMYACMYAYHVAITHTHTKHTCTHTHTHTH